MVRCKTATARLETSWGVGATYVTTAGDTTVTIGGGIADGEKLKLVLNQVLIKVVCMLV